MTATIATAQIHHMAEGPDDTISARTVPILTPTIQMSAPSPGDPMEITTPTATSPNPANKTPDRDFHTSTPKTAPPTIATMTNATNVATTTTMTTATTTTTPTTTPTTNTTNASNASNGNSAAMAPATSSATEPVPKSEQPQPLVVTPAGPGGGNTTSGVAGTGSTTTTTVAPAVHQPKIVQTAFIHKLYNMLEDPNIQHLISWSSSAESFVMSPSNDFSKVLAQYFKHTNISSFVRQLNMYGFHKVSDVFANGSDSTLWEFKHGNGNFKRGDLVGLREIKRRASRHSLVHREYNSQKAPPPPPAQPAAPAESMAMQDNADPRFANVDHALYNFDGRLQRQEEAIHYLQMKQQAAMETISRLLQFNQDLTRTLLNMVPNGGESPLHRDVMALQSDLQRQVDMVRTMDEPQEPLYSGSRQYFSSVENAPVSPRQLAQDESRRPNNLSVPQPRSGNFHRPPIPSNLSISTLRPYGSIGSGDAAQSSPGSSSSLRMHLPPPPPVPQHPLANVETAPSNLARRHTAADIRAHGWQTNGGSHFGPPGTGAGPTGPAPPMFPPSPNRLAPEDQRIRESFSAYSLQAASQPHSRPATPPPPPPPPFANGNNGNNGNNGSNAGGGGPDLGSWSWASANRSNNNLSVKDSSAPPTRRGSMAHILNPTETAERDDEDGSPRDDDRKRKRIM